MEVWLVAELLGHVFHTIQFHIFILDILSLPLPADSRKLSASRQLAAVSWKCGSSLSYWDMYFTLFNFTFSSLISCLFLYQLIQGSLVRRDNSQSIHGSVARFPKTVYIIEKLFDKVKIKKSEKNLAHRVNVFVSDATSFPSSS